MVGKVRGDIQTPLLYREVQHFRQAWLWLILLAVAAVCIYALVQQLILGRPFGNNPASDIELIVIAIVIGLGFPTGFYLTNLAVEVHSDGIYLRFFPLHLAFRRIAPEEVKSYQVKTYSPIREYGGWGIRDGSKGKAYNISGNRGVELEISSGKRLLIGSQRPEELAGAINVILGKGQEPGQS